MAVFEAAIRNEPFCLVEATSVQAVGPDRTGRKSTLHRHRVSYFLSVPQETVSGKEGTERSVRDVPSLAPFGRKCKQVGMKMLAVQYGTDTSASPRLGSGHVVL
jgi:hypothetical protein